MDIEKVLLPNKISVGEKNYKYSIGYLYSNHKVKPLHIMLPSAYVISYDGQSKWMYFLTEDDVLLEKYNGAKSVATSKKNLITSLSIINFFLKTKIKSHGDKVTDFYNKIIPNYICVAVISMDSALKKDGNHYQQWVQIH